MQETTYRQYLAWIEWLDKQWNQPNRSDHYLMGIAQRVAQVPHQFTKEGKPNQITLEQQKIEFKQIAREKQEQSEEAKEKLQLSWAKAGWNRILKGSKK